MTQSIIATIRGYLDAAGHCLSDGDTQGSIDRLQDVKEAVATLQGVCRLPSECREGLAEIWK
jgi:hypothetical protein